MSGGKARHRHLKVHAAFLLILLLLSAAVVWQKWRPVIAPGAIDRTYLTPKKQDGAWGYVNADGAWGYVNAWGRWAILPSFREARPFVGDRACVDSGGRYSWIDRSGNIVVPSSYTGVGVVQSEGLAIAMMEGKWGFVTDQGELVVDTVYDRADLFAGGLARVCLKGKWGFIDRASVAVVPLVYDEILPFENGVAWNGQPRDMALMPSAPDEHHGVQRELAGAKKNGLWGFVDRDGTLVIHHTFLEIEPFIGRQPHTVARLPRGWVVIDREGLVLCEPEFIMPPWPELWRIGPMPKMLWTGHIREGLMAFNIGGRVVQIGPHRQSACLGGKWGYLSSDLDVAIHPCFDRPGAFRYGVADVVLNGKPVHIDTRGAVISDEEVVAIREEAARQELLLSVIKDGDPLYRLTEHVEEVMRGRAMAERMKRRAQEQARARQRALPQRGRQRGGPSSTAVQEFREVPGRPR